MNGFPRFFKRHWVLSSLGGLLLLTGLLAGTLMLHAYGYYGVTISSDLPANEDKLQAAALPTVAPGPDAAGETPTFLVLGSPHLAQDADPANAGELKRVTTALSEFRPDMLVVEKLPSDWPVGKGRDYRPDFDLNEYGSRWKLSEARAAEVIDSLGTRTTLSSAEHCRLGRAYFRKRALANALYQWTAADCGAAEGADRLAEWISHERRHEMVQIGFPVARANGVKRVVPFDYQGDDAKWFLGRTLSTVASRWQLFDLIDFWPAVQTRYTLQSYAASHADSLSARLRYSNSPEWLTLQYWAYNQQLAKIEYQDAGPRQLQNYWLRNRKMFAEVEDAISERDPNRIMIVVGRGHKYFLDTLVRRAGYQWVDPRDYLPSS